MREKHKFIGYAIPQVFPCMLLAVFIKLLMDFMNGYLFKPLFIYKIIGRMVFSLNSYLMLFFMMTAEIDVKSVYSVDGNYFMSVLSNKYKDD